MILISILTIILVIVEQYCRMHGKSLLQITHPFWFSDVTRFPQEDFPCKLNCIEYKHTVTNGYISMKDKRVIFCGLCKNISQQIPSLIQRIEHLGSFFKSYAVVIFENDSSDDTRKQLKQWASLNKKVHLLECPEEQNCKLNKVDAISHGIFSQQRMQKMVEFRNRLMSYIRNNLKDYDVVGVLDMDIIGPISIDGIAHSFGNYSMWDSISAYGLNGITLSAGLPFYYDLIAYKDENLDINDNSLNIVPVIMKTSMLPVGSNIIRVKSAFAGLEFYKMNVIQNIDYIPHDGKYSCEHIIFHTNMIRKGYDRIYMNPNMIVLVGLQGDHKRYPFH